MRRMCIIILPVAAVFACGLIMSVYMEMNGWTQAATAVAALWFLICAAAFARPSAAVKRDAAPQIGRKPEITAKSDGAGIKPLAVCEEVKRDYGREALARDCRRAIEEMERYADNATSTNAASVTLRDIEDGLANLEGFELALRKAVGMCEDVTNEVYILSVLANVEVGAHADSIAGFEVLAKQIQPLAESGAMAAIEAKASLDAAFASIGGMLGGIRSVLREIEAEGERRRRLMTSIGDAERAVERMSYKADGGEK